MDFIRAMSWPFRTIKVSGVTDANGDVSLDVETFDAPFRFLGIRCNVATNATDTGYAEVTVYGKRPFTKAVEFPTLASGDFSGLDVELPCGPLKVECKALTTGAGGDAVDLFVYVSDAVVGYRPRGM